MFQLYSKDADNWSNVHYELKNINSYAIIVHDMIFVRYRYNASKMSFDMIRKFY